MARHPTVVQHRETSVLTQCVDKRIYPGADKLAHGLRGHSGREQDRLEIARRTEIPQRCTGHDYGRDMHTRVFKQRHHGCRSTCRSHGNQSSATVQFRQYPRAHGAHTAVAAEQRAVKVCDKECLHKVSEQCQGYLRTSAGIREGVVMGREIIAATCGHGMKLMVVEATHQPP